MGSRQLPDFDALIVRIATALQSQNLPFMLIGGQAVLLHGRPRLMEDEEFSSVPGRETMSETLQEIRSELM